MPIFENNAFTRDALAVRTARLQALKTYINNYVEKLAIPVKLAEWGATAYGFWTVLLSLSTVEQGEAAESYQNMHEADENTFSYGIKCRDLLRDSYGADDKILKIYGITGAFPSQRKAKIKAVQDLIDGHNRLKQEEDPNILPDAFIEKLQGYLNVSNDSYANLILKEQPEADQAIDDQNEQFEADSKNLRNLYNWTLMTWSEYEPFLVQLGFAPKINRPGGGQPDAPAGLNKQWLDSELMLSWNPCENATSYQLVYSEDNETWEDLYAGNEASYTYSPPEGKRTYRIRARNAKGYSDWSNVIEFIKPENAE